MKTFFTSLPFFWTFISPNNKSRNAKDFEKLEFHEAKIVRKDNAAYVNNAKQLIINNLNEDGFEFISNYVSFETKRYFNLISNKLLIDRYKQESLAVSAIQLENLNECKNLHKSLNEINESLEMNGIFLGFLNSQNQWKKSIKSRFGFPAGHLIIFVTFCWQMILQLVMKKSTIKRYANLSKAELYGRLYYNGFEIIGEKETETQLFFAAKKLAKSCKEDKKHGLFIVLNRVGKNGKKIKVYKIRSMYPYSEYLQEYIYEHNNLQDGGKFKDDFRISPTGKFIRKMWIDEIPMFFNLLKGDIKIFGVRPLSNQYFGLYPKELQVLRTQTKPGLVPPFYVDMPRTLDEIIQSEMNYLKAYQKAPLKTDFIYFFKAVNNILLRGKRSH